MKILLSLLAVPLLLSACQEPVQRPVQTMPPLGIKPDRTAPNYPDELEDHPRDGEAAIFCPHVIDDRMNTCKLLAAGGGEPFGRSASEWIASPQARFKSQPKLDEQGNTFFVVHFAGPNATPLDGQIIAGGTASLPPGIATKQVAFSCIIDEEGALHSCRIIWPDPGSPWAKAGMAWLTSGGVRLAITRAYQPGAHIVVVPFAPRNAASMKP